MNNFKFIKLVKNLQIPVNNSNFKQTYELKDIDTKKYNVGLIAGANNLIILDVDIKDGGLNEWKEYIKQYGEPLTLKQQTPSGGFHYVFKQYDDQYTEEENIIIDSFKNKSKMGGFGLDIRKGNGYICFEPSIINNEKYTNGEYKILLNMSPCRMNNTLIHWLYNKDQKTNRAINNNLILMSDTQQLKDILTNFKNVNSSTWKHVTTAIKNLLHKYNNELDEDEIIKIWDKWSKEQDGYDKKNNYKIWENINTSINLNYVITHYNNNINKEYKKQVEEHEEHQKQQLDKDKEKWTKKYNKATSEEEKKKLKDTYYSLFEFDEMTDEERAIYKSKYYKLDKPNKIKLLESFKELDELTTPPEIEKITMNNKFIFDEDYEKEQFNYDVFNKYDTIIIKSTTGTGKTSNTAKHIYKLLSETDGEYKFMSIINLISLSHQHLKSFEHINIKSYEDANLNKEDDNLIICINSLLKFQGYSGEFFKNYIVYIDEINSLINSLTHNDTLNKNLKSVYIVLMKIINNCKKIIVSDATINNNVFTLLNKRIDNKIYIINEYKKYDNIKAFKMNDENEFLKKIKEHIKKDEYFLFGCDSKCIIDKYYNDTKTSDETKFKLINSDTKTIIKDASEEWKDKFIYYSPSVTTGIDFNISTPQDVFLYINGKTLTPATSFQQMSRTRNIKDVYIYISDIESKNAEYNTLEATKEHFKYISSYHPTLNKMCLNCIDEEYIFNENAYFNLFTYNEYINDTYSTNKKQHFYNILNSNGFNIIQKGDICKLNKKQKEKMKNNKEAQEERIFNKTIQELKSDEEIKNIETAQYKRIITLLNIPHDNDELIIKYDNLIKDKYLLGDYFNFIKLLKPEKTILKKIGDENRGTPQYKALYTNYYKISLLYQLEKELKITRFNFKKLDEDKPFKISDDLIKKINISFRTDKTPKETYNNYIDYYTHKIKHILNKIEITDTEKKQVNKIRSQHTQINKKLFNYYLKLYELTDDKREYIVSYDFYDELKAPLESNNINFIDDDDKELLWIWDEDINNYYLGRVKKE